MKSTDKVTTVVQQIEGSKWTIQIDVVINEKNESRMLDINTLNFERLATGRFAEDLNILIIALFKYESFKTAFTNCLPTSLTKLESLLLLLESEHNVNNPNFNYVKQFRAKYFCDTFTPFGRLIPKVKF